MDGFNESFQYLTKERLKPWEESIVQLLAGTVPTVIDTFRAEQVLILTDDAYTTLCKKGLEAIGFKEFFPEDKKDDDTEDVVETENIVEAEEVKKTEKELNHICHIYAWASLCMILNLTMSTMTFHPWYDSACKQIKRATIKNYSHWLIPRSIEKASRPSKFTKAPYTMPRDWGVEQVVLLATTDKERKPYMLHRSVACGISPVLSAAFNCPFTEGQIGEYKLKHAHPVVVSHFLSWAYRGILEVDWKFEGRDWWIDIKSVKEGIIGTNHGKYIENWMNVLVGLWVLGDRLIIPSLQNLVINKLYDMSFVSHEFQPATLHYLYENTTIPATLRDFAVQHFGYAKAWDHRDLNEYPEEFLYDVARSRNLTPRQLELDHHYCNLEEWYVVRPGRRQGLSEKVAGKA
ncbi:hypothetical protein BJ878DRAFT_156297 [Calycina marina]|uniref:BTB domain-containing protein n=1 Tax=Calycina marina TaxID=1763456 RepID=A0A9P7YZ79_9HELO|nr:hypothetical protein BJ878DRAFT_156297 [Calycina marina]